MRKSILAVTFLLCCHGTALAQATPAPASSPTPQPLTYGGYVRSYYFTRTNASPYGLPQDTNVLNQATSNNAVSVHAAYNLGNWSIGGTYLYANPLNNCTTAADQLQTGGPCSGKTATFKSGGSTFLYNPVPTNPDNTLPGFQLSTLYEAYLQYKDANLYAKVGDQLLTTPWANGADTRLKPAAYQGADVSYKLTPDWTIEGAYIDRFESRVDSDFVNSTLLTATNQADAPGPGANLLIPKYSAITTNGFAYGRLGFAQGRLASNVHVYDFLDIATAEWLDAKYTIPEPEKPYISLQAGNEANSGRAVLGKINSQVIGLAGGISPLPSLDLVIGFDYIPQKSDTITLPSGVSCSAVPSQPPSKTPTGNQISVTGTIPLMYFLPTGGTPNCVNAATKGTATIYYGGWASPYTDSYTSDPLYTTSMTGGMVERRSPGTSGKVTATWWGDNRQIRLITSFALYAYGNSTSGVAPSHELDIDGTYYFSHVPKTGSYKGLLLRHRYGDRDMTFVQYYGGLPVFKYNRTQLEYDF